MRQQVDSTQNQFQTPEDIERELQEKLASLGINIGTTKPIPTGQRVTQQLPTSVDEKRTTVLDLSELRNALRQQIDIAEIKREIEMVLKGIVKAPAAQAAHTQELELKAAALMLPYCRKYIDDFPDNVRASEFAVDLNLQDIIDFHSDTSDMTEEELNDLVEQYSVQIIQTLLSHPLIPQKTAKRIGVDLKTTALKDERGTAMYTASDAQFLGFLINEQELIERGGEVGLLAILISGKKWNKIDSETLFHTAVLYTLEAMAKKRGIPSIVLRGQGDDHPIAYITTEYICHNLDQSLETLIDFIENFFQTVHQILCASSEEFIQQFYEHFLPKLKEIFHNQIHESFDRFLEIFRREYQKSQQSQRSRIFFFKRCADLCELSFYCHESIRTLVRDQGGEIYAKERLDEGTKHFASRNNIPLDETGDFLTQKNTLSELLFFTLKQRCTQKEETSPTHMVSILMNDLLFFLDNLRRVFDHSYARGRSASNADYNSWEEVVADCSQSYSRLFLGRGMTDIERYHFEQIYKKTIEQYLSFFELQTPMVFSSSDFKMEKFSKMKRPEENIKEQFLKFMHSLHHALINFNPHKSENSFAPAPEPNRATMSSTAALSLETVHTRAFLSQSDMQLSDFTIESLSSAVSPDIKDKVALVQALRSASELVQKAQTTIEIKALISLLRNLQQRVSLLYILTEDEKNQWRNSLATSISELEQSDPIALSSYGIVLNSIESWELSDERLVQEWKNPETSIIRLEQIFFILLQTRTLERIRALIEEFKRWVDLTPMQSDSPRKRAFDRRVTLLQEFISKGSFKLKLFKLTLSFLEYFQLSMEVTDWNPNPAYLIEDLLAVETPSKRIRQIEAVLSIQDPEKSLELLEKFQKLLNERCQQSASGYSYYTEEEQEIMKKRLRRFEPFKSRTVWKVRKDRMIYSLCRLLTKPMKHYTTDSKI